MNGRTSPANCRTGFVTLPCRKRGVPVAKDCQAAATAVLPADFVEELRSVAAGRGMEHTTGIGDIAVIQENPRAGLKPIFKRAYPAAPALLTKERSLSLLGDMK
jgi:hypothetical protein